MKAKLSVGSGEVRGFDRKRQLARVKQSSSSVASIYIYIYINILGNQIYFYGYNSSFKCNRVKVYTFPIRNVGSQR